MIIKLQRRPRTADGIQLTADNIQECYDFIDSPAAEIMRDSIMIRRNGTHIETLFIGEWAVRGMDNKIRILTDEELKSKYEVRAAGCELDEQSHF